MVLAGLSCERWQLEPETPHIRYVSLRMLRFKSSGILEWFTGKPLIQLDEKVSEPLKNAHHLVHMGHIIKLSIEVDQNGEWHLKEAKL